MSNENEMTEITRRFGKNVLEQQLVKKYVCGKNQTSKKAKSTQATLHDGKSSHHATTSQSETVLKIVQWI